MSVEYKIDGLSMSLRYENGEWRSRRRAATALISVRMSLRMRKVIKDVKQELKDKPEYLEIRGEVYMKNEAFDKP